MGAPDGLCWPEDAQACMVHSLRSYTQLAELKDVEDVRLIDELCSAMKSSASASAALSKRSRPSVSGAVRGARPSPSRQLLYVLAQQRFWRTHAERICDGNQFSCGALRRGAGAAEASIRRRGVRRRVRTESHQADASRDRWLAPDMRARSMWRAPARAASLSCSDGTRRGWRERRSVTGRFQQENDSEKATAERPRVREKDRFTQAHAR